MSRSHSRGGRNCSQQQRSQRYHARSARGVDGDGGATKDKRGMLRLILGSAGLSAHPLQNQLRHPLRQRHAPCCEHEARSSSMSYASVAASSGWKEWRELRVSPGVAFDTLCSPTATTTPTLCCPRKGHLLHCPRLEGAEGGVLCSDAEEFWTLSTKSSRCWQEEEA